MDLLHYSNQELHTMVDLLQWRASFMPDRKVFTFLADGEKEDAFLTFGELDRQARTIGVLLQSCTNTGDRVLLLYPPGLEFIAAFFGCLYAGVMAVPAYPPRPNRPMPRLQAVISDAQAAAVLTVESVYTVIQKAPEYVNNFNTMKWITTDSLPDNCRDSWRVPTINSETIAFLQYTSGSTAVPKGVMVSHENLLYNELMIKHAYNHTEESTYVSWLPFFHDMGLIGNILQCVYIGAKCVLMAPAAFLQKPCRWLEAVSKYKAHTSGGPNFAYDLCVKNISEEQKAFLDLSSWTAAFNGSEPVRHLSIERFSEAFASCGFRKEAFYPCYGLAEATLFVTGGSISGPPVMLKVDEKALKQNNISNSPENQGGIKILTGCGHTWLAQEVIIANPETMTVCPYDRVGEIWIAGTNIAKGYWGKDEETRLTFGAYLGDTGKGPYLRTGDLGFIRDGELFVTGRLKDLIIIRGRNHYSHDIELTVEECHEALRSGCGAAFSIDVENDEKLIIVQEVERQFRNKNLDDVISAIRSAVFRQHELQIHAVVLIKPGSIPKTSSGKIQRRKCRADYLSGGLEVVCEWNEAGAFAGTGTAAADSSFNKDFTIGRTPCTDVLTALISIISQHFHVNLPEIDADKPVIYYGMDSLKVMELSHSIENALGSVILVSDLFEELSIRELAAILENRLTKPEIREDKPSRDAEGENSGLQVSGGQDKEGDDHRLPASRGQKALWFIHRFNPYSCAYNITRTLRINGDLNIPALEYAFQVLTDRHEALRITFAASNGEPVQIIKKNAKAYFLMEDASLWKDESLNRILIEEGSRPFDLEKGPLLRINLYKKSSSEHIMLFSIHHIICDFWSLAILMNELGLLYSGRIQGRHVNLPSPGSDYQEYVGWQEGILSGYEGERLGKYWSKQLGRSLPVLNLPTDKPRMPVQTFNGRAVFLKVSPETVNDLMRHAAAEGANLYMTLLAAFNILLWRYSGQDDILIGSPSAGRERAGFSNTVGYFANPLVVRTKLSNGQTFVDLLRDVRSTVIDAYKHQNFPFVTLVEQLQPERDLSRSPVFQVMFIQQKAQLLVDSDLNLFALGEPGAGLNIGGLELESMDTGLHTAQFDITLSFAECGGSLAISIVYNSDLFNASTMERMSRHYGNILSDIAINPRKDISKINFLSPEEREFLIKGFNATLMDYPSEKCIHQIFEEQALINPDVLAVVFNKDRITYSELDRRSNKLAYYLKSLGIRQETVVAICLERSLDIPVGLLGVLKAGGAYLPLDISYPEERLKYMIKDAKPLIILTYGNIKASFTGFGIKVVCIDDDWARIEEASMKNTVITADASASDSLAYIIYTSGSTGWPKGVQITHRSVVNFLYSMRLKPGFSKQDVLLSVTTLSFDIAALEIFLPLVCGGCVAIAPRDAVSDGARLADLLKRHDVTVMQATPATWRLMLESGWKGRKGLKILCGGEMLDRGLANKLLDMGNSLWNMYGPTETTIWSATCRIESREGPVPVGTPIGNTQIYILDSSLQPVPTGVTGELYIGGHGLSRGYFDRPELTNDRFVIISTDEQSLGRVYRTGDLARYLPDGNIEVLGRTDNQVKIRGYRIEQGEIEASLNEHPAVHKSVVTTYEISPGDRRLVAYYTGSMKGRSKDSELRDYIRSKLPEYMIPSLFIYMEHLPLTPNGKIDRSALPAPGDGETVIQAGNAGHFDEIEETIAVIWREVLHRDRVGVNDKFFDIGGHSLLLARILNRLKESLDERLVKDILMIDLFKYPTIASLAAYIRTKGGNERHSAQVNMIAGEEKKDESKHKLEFRKHTAEIAVIGMACRFPGADNVDEFWRNLINGVESISFFTEEELISTGINPDLIKDPNYVKARGIINSAENFDAAFFGFSPREAEILDPQHRVFLECAWEALENAGYDTGRYDGKVGLYAGVGLNHYLLDNYSRFDFKDTAGNYQLYIGNDKDFVPTRVSYKLDLKGPAVSIQTACSSSLVALHMACRSLRDGECDIALAGGVSIRLPQKDGYMYQQGGIPSRDGHCRAFDEKAGGTVFGNGAGIVVLKPLEMAVADGDCIHAVIKGSAINNDGASKIGYTAPSVEGQSAVIRSALENAGIGSETISYIEAHGTGTELGDPIEFEALRKVFADCTEKRFCGIGSVKTNIGHLDTAAGAAGLIKCVLTLKHGLLPPTLHFNSPNPGINLEDSPFYINSTLTEWKGDIHPRRAGVSSFGIGGTNAHVILEGPPSRPEMEIKRPYQLLAISAGTDTVLESASVNLSSYISQNPELNIADAAYTLAKGRKAMECRRVVICRDSMDAKGLLESHDSVKVFTGRCKETPPEIVFMFPGQGSQYIGMAADLYKYEPDFRQTVDFCSEFLTHHYGINLRECIYPSGKNAAVEIKENIPEIDNTALAQPALFVIEYALARLWMGWGLRPRAMIGHSIGEYTAACLSSVFTLEEALLLVAERGRLVQGLPEGAMLAVPKSEKQVREYLEKHPEFKQIDIAAINATLLCTVSGSCSMIDILAKQMIQEGITCRRLHTSHAFHSRMMEPVLRHFKEILSGIELKSPIIPFVSNVTGKWIKIQEAVDPEYWVNHLRKTVRFLDGIRTLTENNGDILLEVGPGQSLCSFTRQVFDKKDARLMLSSVRHPSDSQPDVEFMLKTLGKLWLEGIQVYWDGFYKNEKRYRIPLPTYPFERRKYLMDLRNRNKASETGLKENNGLSDWFYIPSWKKSMPPFNSKLSNKGKNNACWLVFADECGIGPGITDLLETTGNKVVVVTIGSGFAVINNRKDSYSVNPGKRWDFEMLFEELDSRELLPDHIAYLWSIDLNEQKYLDFVNTDIRFDLYFNSLVYISQAAGKYYTDRSTEISIITNDMWKVESCDTISALKSLILGPAKVIPAEYPGIECYCIDIRLPGMDANTSVMQQLIRQLSAELCSGLKDKMVSYRGSSRWVHTYENIKIDAGAEPGLRLRKGGVYLITGGLGGIGLKLAEYLAEAMKARLVLTGRSAFPERDLWKQWISGHDVSDPISVKINRIIAMENSGASVDIYCADVCNSDQMKQVVEKIMKQYGVINGVIHAAGLPGGGMIRMKTADAAEKVLLPKVKGTITLQESLKDAELDFFMMCSSITSIEGGFGQVDYTAANAFMDAFANDYASNGETFYISIDWDRWKGTGMAADIGIASGVGAESAIYGGTSHPLLDRLISGKTDSLTYLTEFSTKRHWVLTEHTVAGVPTVPGTTYLEMARAAFEKYAVGGPVEIRDVVFTTPLKVNEGEKRNVFTILENKGNSYEFIITSEVDGIKNRGLSSEEHARGKISNAALKNIEAITYTGAGLNIKSEYDMDGLVSEYHMNEIDISGEYGKKADGNIVKTGPRWDNIKKVYAGINEVIAIIELTAGFDSDILTMKLHPALLDVATGLVRYIEGTDNYLPLAYEKITVLKGMTGKMIVHMEVIKKDTHGSGIISCDVHIHDEAGDRLLDIEGFSMRKISKDALNGLKKPDYDIKTGPLYLPGDGSPDEYVAVAAEPEMIWRRDNPADAVDFGITPKEGVEIFKRVISGSTLPQVVISTRDLETVIKEGGNLNELKIIKSLETLHAQKPLHERPNVENPYTAPESELERKITEIWQVILGIDRVGINDNFFELGGTSLTGIQVVSEIKKNLGAEISTVSIFEAPTVSLLAKLLGQGKDKRLAGNAKERAEKKKEAYSRRTGTARKG